MKSSRTIAVGIVIALILWIASGYVINGSSAKPASQAVQERETLMKVRVRDFDRQSVTSVLFVQGQLEPWRSVTLRAETSGTVEVINVDRGTRVSKGDVLAQISMDDREIRLAKAEAQLAQSQADLAASERLLKKKMQSENSVRAAKATVAVAEAELAAIKLDIERTSIRAPFDGVVEDRPAEVGVLLERGDSVTTVVEDTRLKATAQVPQQSIGSLSIGQPVDVTLISGEQVEGTLTFISRLADEGTRSYRIEVEVPNTDLSLVSGLSAVLEMPTGDSDGHFMSPSLLILHDDGSLGVMAVDASDKAVFYPVDLIRSEDGGVWVSGLPDQVRLITFGQGFIQAGEQVIPVSESES